jgi:H/ACA ribonucleoprotein complex subunit 4
MSKVERFIVKDEEQVNEKYGHYPEKRPINEYINYGLVLLDKPAGPTSHEVVAWVKKMLNVKRAGHSGTLDPPVTGMLPIGLEDATKGLSVLLIGPKEYIAVARIHSSVPNEMIMNVIKEFTGEIYQRPPQRASVKRVVRTRRIYELELIEKHGNLLLLRVLCQAGTYVRKLIYDIGEVLKVGATMVELRRTKVSPFSENKDGMVTLHQLLNAVHSLREKGDEDKIRRYVKPIEHAFVELPKVIIRDTAVDAICNGAQLAVPGILSFTPNIKIGSIVGVFTKKGEVVAICEALISAKELMEAEKGIAFKTKRVIMKAGTYPRAWKS